MADRAPASVPQIVLAGARRGDQRAFDKVYSTYHPYLVRHLRLTCGAKADDVAAAAWESVARDIAKFAGDGDDFRRWLFVIARRRLIDDLRRDERRPRVVAELEGNEPTVEPSTELEAADWVADALRRIPTRQAEVISLRVVGGLSVPDVASLLGITEGNVRVLSHRGLLALREMLDAAGADRGAGEAFWMVL